jgi:hypothetical protein
MVKNVTFQVLIAADMKIRAVTRVGQEGHSFQVQCMQGQKMNKMNTKNEGFYNFFSGGGAQFSSLPHAQETLVTALIKMTVFWDVTPCSLVETDQCFRGAYCLCHQRNKSLFGMLMMEAANTSETLVNIY